MTVRHPSTVSRMVVVVGGLNLLAIAGVVWLMGQAGEVAGVALVAYVLGVRHAFDVDHIAAIDNVTRRLLANGQRPVGVGLYFSLGHCAVVFALTALFAGGVMRADLWMPEFGRWGEVLGTIVSAGFLTIIGLSNLKVLVENSVADRRGPHSTAGGTLLSRFDFSRVDSGPKMFRLGALFGLSFDTASEVALLAISVTAMQSGQLPFWGVLIFPVAFAAGMALFDSAQGQLMLRLYGWAMNDSERRLRLNAWVTGIAVFLALSVASFEWLQLFWLGGTELPSAELGLLATIVMLGLWWLARSRPRKQKV